MWQAQDNQLYRQFKFKDFKQALAFITEVGKVAEQMNHHPRWLNEYNRVEIWLSTHSAGKITDKDHQLAKSIDKIYNEVDN